MDEQEEVLNGMRQTLEDLIALKSGQKKEEDIKKEVVIVTLTGSDALFYRHAMAIVKKGHEGEHNKSCFLLGLREATNMALKHMSGPREEE